MANAYAITLKPSVQSTGIKSHDTFHKSEKVLVKIQNTMLLPSMEDSPTARNSDDLNYHDSSNDHKVVHTQLNSSSRYVDTSTDRN